MPRSNAARSFAQDQDRYYPVMLLSDAQQALSALADIDFRYDALIERLEERRHNSVRQDQTLRDRLLTRKSRERRRYVEALDAVESITFALTGLRS